jgi:hypothetical protein
MIYRLILFVACLSLAASTFAQNIPLVYSKEQIDVGCNFNALLEFSELKSYPHLTDPLEWADGRGRISGFSDWACRRAEIKREIEHYEIGPKPVKPENIKADFKGDTLRVTVMENGQVLELTAAVKLPMGRGPFPALIGIGRGSGSLPDSIFSNRDVVQIAFNFTQVMSHTQKRGTEPYNRIYPDLEYAGAYSAWAWGISRIIDGLELVQGDLSVDLSHLAVTGCSFAGKMALFAGAFDERIALTIVQESGGGGAAAWRVSETLGNVETLKRTSHAWFMEDMFQFGEHVDKLPFDHHELIAMVAPRALLFLGNPDYEWLAEASGYVSSRAAHEVWKTFGISDRFGFSIIPGHNHCQIHPDQLPEVTAFVDKFLLNKKQVSTDFSIHPYLDLDYQYWIKEWVDKPLQKFQ